jgi:hypothetical protein
MYNSIKNSELELPGLAIIIDCWNHQRISDEINLRAPQYPLISPPDPERYNSVMTSIKNFCERDHNIQAIALASYGNDNNHVSCVDPGWDNAKQFFVNETKLDFLRKMFNSVSASNQEFTHPTIRDIKLRSDQVIFTAFNELQILYYCNNINPSIKNIYFLGAQWEMCVKNRPVGWLQVAGLLYHNMFSSTKNLLTRRDCVYVKKNEIDDNRWQPLDMQTLQLKNFSHWSDWT